MRRLRPLVFYLIGACAVLFAQVSAAWAASLGDNAWNWPSWTEFWRVVSLRDYNTRVVMVGTTLLGFAAGLTGTFLLLRKRALLSDALSHATLPGIVLAFMLMTAYLGQGKNLIGLIAGAAVFSVLGTMSVLLIQRHSRLKDDAALGIVLSVYFGLGVALMGLATRMSTGEAAGLSSFIYGKTASMLYFDAVLIAATALFAALACLFLFKEFALLCFDAGFAATQGWPVARLDFFMMALVVAVTVVGLQAVGLILVVALLIIPPSAARFWSNQLSRTLWLSGLFGAISALSGSAVSALMANLPAGAVIVLAASGVFLFSLAFGAERGLLKVGLERIRLRRKIAGENLLREIYEWLEATGEKSAEHLEKRASETSVPLEEILPRRSWGRRGLESMVNRTAKKGFLKRVENDAVRLTGKGFEEARQVVRKHRLWETYLITHADIAPGQVDFGADRIEHLLDPEMIAKLEKLLPEMAAEKAPRSPHRLEAAKSEV